MSFSCFVASSLSTEGLLKDKIPTTGTSITIPKTLPGFDFTKLFFAKINDVQRALFCNFFASQFQEYFVSKCAPKFTQYVAIIRQICAPFAKRYLQQNATNFVSKATNLLFLSKLKPGIWSDFVILFLGFGRWFDSGDSGRLHGHQGLTNGGLPLLGSITAFGRRILA